MLPISRLTHSSEQKLLDDLGSYSAGRPRRSPSPVYVCSHSSDGDFFCSIESYMASKDSYRVVGDNVPRPYPLRSSACSIEMATIVTDFVAGKAADILRDHSIKAIVSLKQRWRGHEDAIHTYLVETTSDSTDVSNWKSAAIQINQVCLTAGVAQADIEVEIVNASLCIHNVSSVLPYQPTLLVALENLRPKIVDFLRLNASAHWTSVAFHMRRHALRPTEPGRPTILIMFRAGAVSCFGTLKAGVREIVKTERVQVDVEFLCGHVSQ